MASYLIDDGLHCNCCGGHLVGEDAIEVRSRMALLKLTFCRACFRDRRRTVIAKIVKFGMPRKLR